MRTIFSFLAEQPFLLVFLVVAGGYALGKVSIRGIGLGVTGSTLLVGLLLSLAAYLFGVRIQLPELVSAIFFNLFIFAIGLRVGPQFFSNLGRGGKQIVVIGIATVVSASLLALACGRLFKLPRGAVAGVLAGAGTSSPAFGAAQSAIRATAHKYDNIDPILAQQSTAFAIGYVIGMLGLLVLIKFLPQIFRTDIRGAAAKLQAELDAASPFEVPGTSPAYQREMPAEADVRVFRVEHDELVGRTIGELKTRYPRIVIEQVRRGDAILCADDELRLARHDEVALAGVVSQLLEFAPKVGGEIEDVRMRDIAYETADIVVQRTELVGHPVQEVMRSAGHGCFLRAFFRMGEQMPPHPQLALKRNDVLRVIGNPRHTQALERVAGPAVRASLDTDMITLAIGLVLGALIGAFHVTIHGVQVGLGAAGGMMLAAILLSALRARRPAFGGPVPESARRMFEHIGVALFVTVLGLNTGANLPAALAAGSLETMIVAIIIVGFAPLFLGWALGLVMKLNPSILLGAIAGANQNSAALKVAEEDTASDGPALGFPVGFAVGTLALSIAAYIVALIE